jgi:hypothetical protein
MVAKATETCWRLMIYVKAYFNDVHFFVHYESIKNFLCFTSSEAEIARSVQWLGVPGFDSRQWSGIFLHSKTSIPFLEPVFYSVGFGIHSSGVKRRGREVVQSRLSSAKVKNEWTYTSPPPIRLHVVDRENFSFKLYVFMAHCVLTNKFTVADYTHYNGVQWILSPFFPLRSTPSRIQNILTFPNLNPCFPLKKSEKQRPVSQRFLNSSQQRTQTDPKRESASTFSFISANSCIFDITLSVSR